MGKKFGNLAKISGITYFRLSPYEQKSFAGAISDGAPNLLRRINESILYVVPWFIGTYILMDWATEENHKLHRKNPADYANDK
ncbi:PREDICTED: cytochrome b-c1 complex subunit 8 [Dufourea novaeangliae]|uniref:Cytochrome b-c1 complex subunit 8 n=1 Tax=Dufourea novaeangliae TaxID=178035 RepID=A0A154NZ90_DUFNO|nr:PREDICTED: cytochrome b-c1 complex subunit 8 [Dufourea novaeangliae]KZC04318.1 Cytochrome b-c1 complex subunit 8 [Dufourea novaeangliae]